MKFCALDLELDQPSGEIIQIGAIIYDTRGEVYDTFNVMCSHGKEPSWDTVLRGGGTLGDLLGTDFKTCWKLGAICIKEALDMFVDFTNEGNFGSRFTQWGSGDLRSILFELSLTSVRDRIKVNYHDVKQEFEYSYNSVLRPKCKNSGLEKVMAHLGLKYQGRAHDALADAKACMDVHLHMLNRTRIGLGVDKLTEKK
jgi:hypothetical protein